LTMIDLINAFQHASVTKLLFALHESPSCSTIRVCIITRSVGGNGSREKP
jgi:hypothetical protein